MTITLPRFQIVAITAALALLIAFQWGHAPMARAADLACGSNVSSDLTLTHDLVCDSTFLGNILTVTANGITINGAGFKIEGINAPIGINLTSGNTGVIVRDVSIETKLGIRVTGGGDNTFENVSALTTAPKLSTVGIQIVSSSRNLVVGSSATGYAQGIRLQGDSDNNRIGNPVGDDDPADKNLITGNGNGVWLDADTDNNLIKGNDLSGNNQAVYGKPIITGSGNQFIDNDMSNSAGYSIILAKDNDFVISGNDFANSFSGIHLHDMSGITLSGDDVNLSTLGLDSVGVQLDNVTGSVLTGISIPSRVGVRVVGGGGNLIARVDTSKGTGTSLPKLGVGFQFVTTSGNLVVDSTASNHSEGIRFDHLSDSNLASCSTITDNAVGVRAVSSFVGVSVTNSLIQGNSTGALNQGAALLLAENNYWGEPDGPAPVGSGDSIPGPVDALPFLTSADDLGPLCPDTQFSSLELAIDIQPSKLNTGSEGVLPVAILGSTEIDVTDIGVSTIRLNEAEAAHDGHVEDVNEDGADDLMVHFPVPDLVIDPDPLDGEEVTLTLTGEIDGVPFSGEDTVIIKLANEKGGKK